MTTQIFVPGPPRQYQPPIKNTTIDAPRPQKKKVVDAACPLRPGEPCTLCQAFCTGPHDCQTVKLVMEDPELRALMVEKRREYARRNKSEYAQGNKK